MATRKNIRLFSISVALTIFLAACLPATPMPPISAETVAEFTLAPDQIVTITDTGLTIKLLGVSSDERCPSEIECAVSGPVSISLSIQMGKEDSTSVNLQTFTDNNGRSPDMQFKAIDDRITYNGYLIRVLGVLPYPVNSTSKIKNSEYRVTLMVSKE